MIACPAKWHFTLDFDITIVIYETWKPHLYLLIKAFIILSK